MKELLATLIAIPKAFEGETSTLQLAACNSWHTIKNIEVILIGDEIGIAEICKQFNFKHISSVKKTNLGTPILNDAFDQARKISSTSTLIYINADIILDPNIESILLSNPFSDYLVAGRRTDVDPWAEEQMATFKEWKYRAMAHGTLVPPYSSDFFILPFDSKIFNNMPELVVGRKGWDNWIMFQARNLKLPLIDATTAVMTIHRKHGYNHIKGKFENSLNPWDGNESREQDKKFGNRQLSLSYATYFFNIDGKLKKRKTDISALVNECNFRIIQSNSRIAKFFWKILRKSLQLINK